MSLESVLMENTAAIKELTEAVQAMSAAAPVKPAKVAKAPLKVVKTEEVVVAPVVEKVVEPEVVVTESDDQPFAISIDEVRKQLMPLVADYNPLIAETITSLGATNLSSLDESKYQELLDTINAKIAATS
jgi:hypothetical protein